jgi:ADP-ribosylglycohydrolase
MNKNELIINGLYGLAVADAVGDPFEFMTNINKTDVVMYARDSDMDELQITDDTQMSIFGFDAALKIGNSTDIALIDREFTVAYQNWYTTQTESIHNSRIGLGLLSFPELYRRRAPGYTCLNSINEINLGNVVANKSKGCGSVMRLLPALLCADPMISGKISGAITHKHPENDIAIELYINTAQELLSGNVVKWPYNAIDSISGAGTGWTALECVRMALWAFVNARNYDELLTLSIAHDGDSDSVGAVAGSLWGLSGKHVPTQYIEKLKERDVIQYIATQIRKTK